jgi:hypothetical protein
MNAALPGHLERAVQRMDRGIRVRAVDRSPARFRRHKHLPLTRLPKPHVVLHDDAATPVGVPVALPLEDSLGCIMLLLPGVLSSSRI